MGCILRLGAFCNRPSTLTYATCHPNPSTTSHSRPFARKLLKGMILFIPFLCRSECRNSCLTGGKEPLGGAMWSNSPVEKNRVGVLRDAAVWSASVAFRHKSSGWVLFPSRDSNDGPYLLCRLLPSAAGVAAGIEELFPPAFFSRCCSRSLRNCSASASVT